MLIIKPLTEEYIEEVSLIEAQSFSMPWKSEDFLNMISHDYAHYYVALCDGEVIGCCGVISSFEDGDVSNVVIKEEYRGRGHGEQMLTYIMEDCRKKGIVNFTLEVRPSNTAAVSLYKKLGFEECGIRKNFYEKPTEDALIMWLRASEEK